MPYASRSWGKAAGAFGPTETVLSGTQGSIDESIDLSFLVPINFLEKNSGFGSMNIAVNLMHAFNICSRSMID